MSDTSEKNIGIALDFSRPNALILTAIPLTAWILFMAVMAAPAFGAQAGRDAAPYNNNDRVISLIVHLADQAHLARDTQFAVRAQAQAGLLVWPYDRDRAREIFRRASRRLLPSAFDSRPASALDRARRQQLRVELLNQLACCDPEIAVTLAREFAISKKPLAVERASFTATSLAEAHDLVDADGRELLVSVALRVAEVDSARALGLGQLSLEAGISPYLDRLLMLIGETDPALADRLFSDAVDYLERHEIVPLCDLHPLSLYLISSVGRSEKDHPNEDGIIRFLNLAFDVVMRNCSVNQAAAPLVAPDRSFEIYCTGKYLLELLPRYMPDRAAQLQSRLSQLNDREPSGRLAGISAAQSLQPFAIEQAARNSANERERDLLYTRAAFRWLAREELSEAQRVASNIANTQMRDRLLLPIALRLMLKSRFEDAMLVTRLIQDTVARTDLIIRLAQGASSLRDTACARTLLDLAELEAAKIERPFVRAQSLLAIVEVFSAIDPARAFGVMQEVVKSINEIPAREIPARARAPSRRRVLNELLPVRRTSRHRRYSNWFTPARFRPLRAWTLIERCSYRSN